MCARRATWGGHRAAQQQEQAAPCATSASPWSSVRATTPRARTRLRCSTSLPSERRPSPTCRCWPCWRRRPRPSSCRSRWGDGVLEVHGQHEIYAPSHPQIGGGIRAYTDSAGRAWSALDVAARYFRAGADKVSIGSDGGRRGGGKGKGRGAAGRGTCAPVLGRQPPLPLPLPLAPSLPSPAVTMAEAYWAGGRAVDGSTAIEQVGRAGRKPLLFPFHSLTFAPPSLPLLHHLRLLQIARVYGSQAVVVSLDPRRCEGRSRRIARPRPPHSSGDAPPTSLPALAGCTCPTPTGAAPPPPLPATTSSRRRCPAPRGRRTCGTSALSRAAARAGPSARTACPSPSRCAVVATGGRGGCLA